MTQLTTDPTETLSAVSTQPAHEPPKLPTLDEAWGIEAGSDVLTGVDDTADDDRPESGSEAQPASDGVKAADAPPSEPKLSRREQERLDNEAAIASERERANTLAQQLEERNRALEVAQQQALQAIGADGEFERLKAKRLSNPTSLSYDEDTKLDQMLALNEHSDALSAIWFRQYQQHYATEAQKVAGRFGLDPKVIEGNTGYASVIEHAVTVTEARVRQETADEITRLKTALKSAEARAVGRTARSPQPAGRSTDSLHDSSTFDPSLPARLNLDRAFA